MNISHGIIKFYLFVLLLCTIKTQFQN